MNRVLVTGASGFIGDPCLPRLVDAGFDVHAVAPDSGGCEYRGATWHRADLLDRVEMRRLMEEVQPTHLLHLAWFVAPGDYWASTENIRWLQAGLDLSCAFADAGGERAVMAGTCAEYGGAAAPFVPGVTPIRPTTLYGAAKAALHIAACAYLRQRGVSFAWGHIFYLFGPRERPERLVPSAIRTLSSGEVFTCEHPDDVKDFLHVDDVASAFVSLLASDVDGDVNIASGEAVAVGALVREIAEYMGRSELVVCMPDVPASPAVVADAARLAGEVGWTPRYTRAAAIANTVDWWSTRGE